MTTVLDMFTSALTGVCDTSFPSWKREEWARVTAFLTSELPPTEATTAAVLLAARKCLNVPTVARTLVIAVWGRYGDRPRVTAWTLKLVERARVEGHTQTVVALTELLVQMEHFTGELSVETVSMLLDAAADQRCHPTLFDFAWYHDQRFKPAGISPAWVRQVLDDPRVLEGARRVPRSTHRLCPCCGITPLWAAGLMARARLRRA